MPRNLYPHDTSWTLERGEDSIDVMVDYGIEERGSPASGHFGPPENYDPGSATVLRIDPMAWVDQHNRIEMTEAEIAAVEQWLLENPDEYDPGEPDYD